MASSTTIAVACAVVVPSVACFCGLFILWFKQRRKMNREMDIELKEPEFRSDTGDLDLDDILQSARTTRKGSIRSTASKRLSKLRPKIKGLRIVPRQEAEKTTEKVEVSSKSSSGQPISDSDGALPTGPEGSGEQQHQDLMRPQVQPPRATTPSSFINFYESVIPIIPAEEDGAVGSAASVDLAPPKVPGSSSDSASHVSLPARQSQLSLQKTDYIRQLAQKDSPGFPRDLNMASLSPSQINLMNNYPPSSKLGASSLSTSRNNSTDKLASTEQPATRFTTVDEPKEDADSASSDSDDSPLAITAKPPVPVSRALSLKKQLQPSGQPTVQPQDLPPQRELPQLPDQIHSLKEPHDTPDNSSYKVPSSSSADTSNSMQSAGAPASETPATETPASSPATSATKPPFINYPPHNFLGIYYTQPSREALLRDLESESADGSGRSTPLSAHTASEGLPKEPKEPTEPRSEVHSIGNRIEKQKTAAKLIGDGRQRNSESSVSSSSESESEEEDDPRIIRKPKNMPALPPLPSLPPLPQIPTTTTTTSSTPAKKASRVVRMRESVMSAHSEESMDSMNSLEPVEQVDSVEQHEIPALPTAAARPASSVSQQPGSLKGAMRAAHVVSLMGDSSDEDEADSNRSSSSSSLRFSNVPVRKNTHTKLHSPFDTPPRKSLYVSPMTDEFQIDEDEPLPDNPLADHSRGNSVYGLVDRRSSSNMGGDEEYSNYARNKRQWLESVRNR